MSGVKAGSSEPTRAKEFLTWAVREAAGGRLTCYTFLKHARALGLCVDRPQELGGVVMCTPWDPGYPSAPKPAARTVPADTIAPCDMHAKRTRRLVLELEDEQRRESWAVACRSEYVVVRAPGEGRWRVPARDLALEVIRWREARPGRVVELPNGCLVLFVPLEEWAEVFGHLREDM